MLGVTVATLLTAWSSTARSTTRTHRRPGHRGLLRPAASASASCGSVATSSSTGGSSRSPTTARSRGEDDLDELHDDLPDLSGSPDGSTAAGGAPRRRGASCRPTRAWRCYDAGVTAARAVCPGRRCSRSASYCGKSAVYLGAAAAARRAPCCSPSTTTAGSEENQPGWEWHEPDLVDPDVGRMDTLPLFRRTVFDAGLETIGGRRGRRLADGGGGSGRRRWPCCSSTAVTASEPATVDYECGPRTSRPGGLLAIHDVFPDPADGGRPPYEIYLPALESGGSPRSAPPDRSGSCAAPESPQTTDPGLSCRSVARATGSQGSLGRVSAARGAALARRLGHADRVGPGGQAGRSQLVRAEPDVQAQPDDGGARP